MKPSAWPTGLVLALFCGCTQPPSEFVTTNFYTGVILLERKQRASETYDSTFDKKLEKIHMGDPDSILIRLERISDSLRKVSAEEEREAEMAFAGVEKIDIAVSPEAFLQAKDTTGMVMEYTYFFDERNSSDEERGTYIYVVIPAPDRIRLGTSYTLPTEEVSIAAWIWGAWIGMQKLKSITGSVTFSRLEPDTITAQISISGKYRLWSDKEAEKLFSNEVQFIRREN